MGDSRTNVLVLQVEVDDVKTFLSKIEQLGGTVSGPAAFDSKGGFWFGAFDDPEGNTFWVVDSKCP